MRKSAVSLKHAKGAEDPWLISTSLKMKGNLGKSLVGIYKTRMQIEEGFRDMKSHRYGLGLGLHQSYKTERLANLVLITTLANFVVFLTGTVAIMTNRHRRYQANTVKNKMILSRVFIGLRVLSDKKMRLTKRHLNDALDKITIDMKELYEGFQ
ncbi:hypothetical protein RGQ13_07355 [Thalassotalea psychrophila]|uniref:Transposase IS4-like domain-containing protein n=1 Tax=Thalassotalea psychrophila TaxID=3065647 RepID=A0ABY9TYB4_9GAMM|nr:hypothetical protein RGQ13_07355 [Colwelliaceae bacterium SQ149]